MDNPITPLDRNSLYPGSARIKQAQETDKEKERKKFSEDLEAELEDEEQKQKKKDSVEIALLEQEAPVDPADQLAVEPPDDKAEPAKRHIDLTA